MTDGGRPLKARATNFHDSPNGLVESPSGARLRLIGLTGLTATMGGLDEPIRAGSKPSGMRVVRTAHDGTGKDARVARMAREGLGEKSGPEGVSL